MWQNLFNKSDLFNPDLVIICNTMQHSIPTPGESSIHWEIDIILGRKDGNINILIILTF